MSSRIAYDDKTAFGQLTAEFAQSLVAAKNQAANLKSAIDSMAVGGTFAQIETEVGLAPGTGETFYNIITDINTKLSSNVLDNAWRVWKG